MNKYQTTEHSSLQIGSDEDFEIMVDMPKEDPIIVERRRQRNNEITKKLGAYLLKGYCMLGDACPECDCILLRTPDRKLLCVGCAEVDVENAKDKKEPSTTTKTGETDQRLKSAESINKNKDRPKRPKKPKKKSSSTSEGGSVSNDSTNYSVQLENKLKWAVDELAKSQNPNRINAMCTVIIKLTESIKALKEYELASAQN